MAPRRDISLLCFAVIVQLATTVADETTTVEPTTTTELITGVPMDTTTTYVTTATTAADASQTTTDRTIPTTTDIGVCLSNPCMYGDCTSNGTGYVCSCWPGAMGVNCDGLNECYINPCAHYCPVSPDQCSCFIGWTGNNCEDIGECWPRSCVNGDCYGDGHSTVCICWPGWTGTFCEVADETTTTEPTTTTELFTHVADETTTTEPTTTTELFTHDTLCFIMEPCVHGDCVDLNVAYECHCYPGWTGTNCEVANETTTPEPTTTTELITSDTWDTTTAYGTGTMAGGDEGQTTTDQTTTTSTDIIDCSSNPCEVGDCVNLDTGYMCMCLEWTGMYKNCEDLDTDVCSWNPCENGDCISRNLSIAYSEIGFECSCWPMWSGIYCEFLDECLLDPCLTNFCVEQCPCIVDYFTDIECEDRPFGECLPSSCVYGNCMWVGAGTKCNCLPCATGTFCEVIIDPLGCGITTMADGLTTTDRTTTTIAATTNPPGDGTTTTTRGDGGQPTTDGTITPVAEHVSSCKSEPCVHGLCTDLNNGYLCTCRPGWTGINCDERQDHGRVGHQRGRN